MKRILIADASKASLVMTSEVFKDNFPGVQVVVARTSADALELAKTCGDVDAFIIDFDLPDRDGANTAAKLKKISDKPILITAFDKPEVHKAIESELAAYEDCQNWIKKPVRAEFVVSIAQRFIEGRYRTQRRLEVDFPAVLEWIIKTPEAPKTAALSEKAKKTPLKTAAAKKEPATKSTKPSATDIAKANAVNKVYIPVTISDASHGGIKISVSKEFIAQSKNKLLAKNFSVSSGIAASVVCANPEFYLNPEFNATEWQQKQLECESLNFDSGLESLKGKKKSGTMSNLSASTKKAVTSKEVPAIMCVKGQTAWFGETETEHYFGLQSDSNGVTKKIFEAALILREQKLAAAPKPCPKLETAQRAQQSQKSARALGGRGLM